MLESSTPSAGEVLKAPPDTIRLRFNEPIELGDEPIRLLDVGGNEVEVGTARARTAEVTVAIPSTLATGSYVVAWKVMSADSHPVSGAFTFAVGSPSVAADGSSAVDLAQRIAGETSGQPVAVDVGMGLSYAGSLLAVGAALTGWTDRRTRRLVVGGGAVGALGLAVVAVAGVGDVGTQAIVGWVGLGGLAASVETPTAARRLLVAAGSVLTLGAFLVVGHTRTATPAALVVTADAAHLAAAAVWTGGLVALLLRVGARRAERASDASDADASDADAADADAPDADALTADVARFSTLAGVAVVVVAVCGSLLGWRILGSWRAVFGTTYGVFLIVKVSLFAVLAALGAFNRFVLVGHPPGEALRRTLLGEVAAVVAIVAVTGVLTSTPPIDDADLAASQFDREKCLETVAIMEGLPGMEDMDHSCPGDPTTTTSPGARRVSEMADFGSGSVTVSLTPAAAGTNRVLLRFTDAAGQPLVPQGAPALQFRLRSQGIGPVEVAAEPTGTPGSYRATVDLVLTGRWEVNVSAVVSDFEQPQAIVELRVS